MKALKKRVINVVNAVNDHVITPIKNKLRRTGEAHGMQSPIAEEEVGVLFNLPLEDEKEVFEQPV